MSPAETELRSAVRAVKRAPEGKRREARARVAAAIPDYVREGHTQAEAVTLSGLSRERVRQICRAAGIEAPPEQRAKGARSTAQDDG
jgi:imidazolonepropionase-like amidohydrolase